MPHIMVDWDTLEDTAPSDWSPLVLWAEHLPFFSIGFSELFCGFLLCILLTLFYSKRLLHVILAKQMYPDLNLF